MKTLFVCLFMAATAAMFAQPNCGFPGDANNDGRADYLDLLPIGLVYGEFFEPRPAWTTNWQVQCFEPWPTGLPATGINAGFSDTNGDGDIDSLDVDVIVLNYDSVHNAPAVPPAQPYQPPLFPNLPCATLYYMFRKDLIDPTRFYADVFFQAPPTFSGAMAAGMRFTYDPTYVIDDSTRVVFDPTNADLMGVGAAFRSTSFQRQLPTGVVEMAVSGKAQNALKLPRQIGTISFVITEDVIIRNDTVPFTLVFDHTLLINANELAICHNTLTDTVKLIVTDVVSPLAANVRFYPNPAFDKLFVKAPAGFEVVSVVVFDAFGRPVICRRGNTREIDLGGLSAGWYCVVINGADRIFRQKILVCKPDY